MSRPKIVCFDLGGVLCKIRHTWAEAIRAAGVPCQKMPDPGFRLNDLDAMHGFQDGSLSRDSYLAVIRDTFGIHNDDDALAVHHHILDRTYPGADRLVADIRAAGLRVGCMSNNNPAHWERFLSPEHFPVVAGLDVHVGSHVVGSNKPDGGIYDAFEKSSGHRGDEIVFFDDSVENLAPAQARGWHAFAVDANGDPPARMRAEL
ncbi:MAG: HAD-IA family hydrolase, partial [Fimbriimonadaceae bacterium]